MNGIFCFVQCGVALPFCVRERAGRYWVLCNARHTQRSFSASLLCPWLLFLHCATVFCERGCVCVCALCIFHHAVVWLLDTWYFSAYSLCGCHCCLFWVCGKRVCVKIPLCAIVRASLAGACILLFFGGLWIGVVFPFSRLSEKKRKEFVCLIGVSKEEIMNNTSHLTRKKKKNQREDGNWGGDMHKGDDRHCSCSGYPKTRRKTMVGGKRQTECSMDFVSSVGVAVPLLLYRPKRGKGTGHLSGRCYLGTDPSLSHAQVSYNFRKGETAARKQASVSHPFPEKKKNDDRAGVRNTQRAL